MLHNFTKVAILGLLVTNQEINEGLANKVSRKVSTDWYCSFAHHDYHLKSGGEAKLSIYILLTFMKGDSSKFVWNN